ncbi:MAG: acylphosphatase [Candidatus Omnitrophica bacterium]|nr:acylphosphatase [Candidatus Omnitrophota bacterium]
MEKRLEAIFKGHVQGVGFRFTVQSLAGKFDIKGFVENLGDGNVQIVAEGEEQELSAFLLAVRNSNLKNYIRDFEVSWPAPTGEFTEFFVRSGG